MEVLKITENEDGSATVDISLTEEENNLLLNYAINNILRDQIERMKKENVET